jgi:hypothetical protein
VDGRSTPNNLLLQVGSWKGSACDPVFPYRNSIRLHILQHHIDGILWTQRHSFDFSAHWREARRTRHANDSLAGAHGSVISSVNIIQVQIRTYLGLLSAVSCAVSASPLWWASSLSSRTAQHCTPVTPPPLATLRAKAHLKLLLATENFGQGAQSNHRQASDRSNHATLHTLTT